MHRTSNLKKNQETMKRAFLGHTIQYICMIAFFVFVFFNSNLSMLTDSVGCSCTIRISEKQGFGGKYLKIMQTHPHTFCYSVFHTPYLNHTWAFWESSEIKPEHDLNVLNSKFNVDVL